MTVTDCSLFSCLTSCHGGLGRGFCFCLRWSSAQLDAPCWHSWGLVGIWLWVFLLDYSEHANLAIFVDDVYRIFLMKQIWSAKCVWKNYLRSWLSTTSCSTLHCCFIMVGSFCMVTLTYKLFYYVYGIKFVLQKTKFNLNYATSRLITQLVIKRPTFLLKGVLLLILFPYFWRQRQRYQCKKYS